MTWPLIGRAAELDHALGWVHDGTGTAILGPAGVGKSRLLSEVVARAESGGMAVVRVTAAQATRSISFAPFTELLPTTPTQDRLVMLGMALRSLREQTNQHGLLLAIDDAHHLDQESLGLVIQVVARGVATLALSARTGEAMNPELVDLWTNGVINRIDIGPLDHESATQLVDAALGLVDDDLAEELWRLAGGNPLVLHELIEGARGTVLKRDDEGRWTRNGQLSVSPRLGDLVFSRLADLPDETRRAMDLVAVGAPLPTSILRTALGDHLRDLEERGLVSEIEHEGGLVAVAAHPLYGEILKENLSQPRVRDALRRLVEAALATEDQKVDQLRLAVWQRDAEVLISAEVALAGATTALVRHDPGLAEELLRTLPQIDAASGLVLGRALSYQQRFPEAEETLRDLASEDPDVSGEIASARAQNLAFGLGRVAEARELLASSVAAAKDPQLIARLMNERAMVSAIQGDFVDARAASEEVLSDLASNTVARAAAYVTLTLAQAMTGDCTGLDSTIEVALRVASESADHLPFAEDQVRIVRVASLVMAGRIGDAANLSEEFRSHHDRGSALLATWLSASFLPWDPAGLHDQSCDAVARAIELYSDSDPFGLELQARGMLALGRAQQGHNDSLAPLEQLDIVVRAPRLSVWTDRGRAWSLVASHQTVDPAVDILIEGGVNAVSGEHFAWAAFCFHDVVRLGRPSLVLDHLRGLPAMAGAHLIETMREHALALETQDPGRLARCAERFASFGALLLAAETWGQASMVSDQVGRPTDAARLCLLSLVSEMSCESSDTPALRLRPSIVSAREAELSRAVATGRTSRAVAEDHFISVRTVDNHLRSVYRKLDIVGREELRDLLAPVLIE